MFGPIKVVFLVSSSFTGCPFHHPELDLAAADPCVRRVSLARFSSNLSAKELRGRSDVSNSLTAASCSDGPW